MSNEVTEADGAVASGEQTPSAMQTKVYQYGLRPPYAGAELVEEQMRRAHRYRNVLTEIARGERTAIRAAIETSAAVTASTEIARDAFARMVEQLELVRKAKIESRSQEIPPELASSVTEARRVRVETLRALDASRRSAQSTPAIKAEITRIRELAHELRINARAHCDLYWGTYQIVEAASDASLKLTLRPGKTISLPLWDGLDTRDPMFVRWTGDAAISAQVMGGATVEDFGTDMRFRIADGGHAHVSRRTGQLKEWSGPRAKSLALRIGSDEQRAPIWAHWNMIMHRPLPEGAIIMRITVRRRMEGPMARWTAELTVRLPEARTTSGVGAVAIDIGWRAMRDGSIRVAAWVDENGERGELRLQPDVISSLERASSLRSTRDKNFETAKTALTNWLATAGSVPAWLSDATRGMYAWRSAGRLAWVAKQWAANRFAGDANGYEPLEAWRYHDYHLWQWESSQRPQALARRLDLYRVCARKLANRYRLAVLERFDLRDVSTRPELEDAETEQSRSARAVRVLAAASEFRLCVTQAMAETVDVDPAYSTHECDKCGTTDEFDAAISLTHQCSGCGAIWDQDENAASVLLRRWRERPSDPDSAGTARKRQGREITGNRFSRAKEAKRARAALDATARNDGPKPRK